VEHLQELEALAERLGVAQQVRFLPSFSDRQRAWLLAACVGVLYTPQQEHFGIVPLEAMAAARPVVACASGGPLESVLNGRTGFLCQPTAAEWADAMAALLADGAAARLGAAARQHVQAKFSREAFGKQLKDCVVDLAAQPIAHQLEERHRGQQRQRTARR
jgi:alpha-1,3/alpha-1,6-mannosyltransferase